MKLNIPRILQKVLVAQAQGAIPSAILLFTLIFTTACELQVEKVDGKYVVSGIPENCEGMSHGETLTFQMYRAPSPAEGQSCESLIVDLVRSCNDGEITQSPEIPTYLTCSTGGGGQLQSCGSVPHGGNVNREGFSINQIPADADYTCNDRKISYVAAVCNNGVEVPSGNPEPIPFYQDCVKLTNPGGDNLEVLKAAKGMSSLNNISTTASFQSQSIAPLSKLSVKIFYARNNDNTSPNTVIAVSDRALIAGSPDSFNQAAVTVRCNAGQFQLRNASAFEDVGMACEVNNAYMIDLAIDGDLKKYDLRIEALGGQSVSKSAVSFRSTYTGAAALSSINVISDRATADGSTRFDRVTQAHISNNVDPTMCGSVANGTVESRERWETEVVPEGSTCRSQSQSRTCNSGTWSAWSGTYTAESCRVDNPIGGGLLPQYVRSFGPNGTHWPEVFPTPFMYDRDPARVPHIFEVEPTWAAISAKLKQITKAQADAGTLILVKPSAGINTGLESTWQTVLSNIGSQSWAKRVTVAPRDGYGSVIFKQKPQFETVVKVAFAGFIWNQLKCRDCHQSALVWSRVDGYLSFPGTHIDIAGRDADSKNRVYTRDLELVEVVMPRHTVDTNDSANGYSAGGHLDRFRIVGSYFAPRYRPPGNSHTDTFQFASGCHDGIPGCDGDMAYTNMKFKDTVIFTSTNCALQTGTLDGLEIDHSYLVGDRNVAFRRYPLLSGADDPRDSNGNLSGFKKVFNGTVLNGFIRDSVLFGGGAANDYNGQAPWKSVVNTKTNISYQYGGVASGGGSFQTVSDLLTQQPFPRDPRDAGFLESLWLDPYK